MKHFYTIPSNHAFVDSLAAGIRSRFGKQMEAHSDMLLLLPNRRSVQALKDAFLRQSDGQATLLPRMIPLGDMDEDEINLLLLSQEKTLDIPPPIAPVRQQLLLAKLTHQWRKAQHGEQAMFVHSLKLAGELVRFLSEVEREQLSLEHLENIYPEEFQAHWQETLDFLKILMHHWPQMLKEQDALTVAEYRNQMLELQAELWRQSPPSYPVIAAGAVGTVPAVSQLLHTISELPNGYVVLPGLDQKLEKEAWVEVSETHPQYEMKQLLEKAECEINDVQIWQENNQFQTSPAARLELVSQLMRPAAAVDAWRHYKPTSEAFTYISQIETSTLHEEAGVIALMLREVLEDEGKTAALVTHDRSLARHVVMALKRWNINVNDSAGKPLLETSPAILLRSVAALLEKDAGVLSLLACLKHPYVSLGYPPLVCVNYVRRLEQYYLRGMCSARTPKELLAQAHLKGEDSEFLDFLERVEGALCPLEKLKRQKEQITLLALFDEILQVAQTLSEDEEQDQSKLWMGDAAEQLQEWFQQLQHVKDLSQSVHVSEARNLFEALMEGVSFRPRYGLHPRLHILGPLEARLQQYDRLILGGLNEGSWPSLPTADPWMSRPMRSQFGLPLPERRIGQSAHDFMQYFCAKEVMLTRSRKIDGAETSPSRWWLRLLAVLKASGNEQALTPKKPWNEWYQSLYESNKTEPLMPPLPMPPVALRPHKLSVTRIELLQQNPYAIYAKNILKLKKLDEIDKAPSAMEFGNLIHDAAEAFSKTGWSEQDTQDIIAAKWLEVADAIFQEQNLPQSIKAIWWPRVERIAFELSGLEIQRRQHIKSLYSEIKGSYQFETNGRSFTLTAEADRLEIDYGNALHVIDYKTGIAPSQSKIDSGEKSQLPLEALIAMKGRFDDMKEKPDTVKELAYWKVSGRKEAFSIKSFPTKKQSDDAIEVWVKEAEDGLKALVDWFEEETHPYLAYPFGSDHLPYDDYAHLIREEEWQQ